MQMEANSARQIDFISVSLLTPIHPSEVERPRNDNALIRGSLLLFVVLAGAMVVTRKVD
jgi:hypothetical protein